QTSSPNVVPTQVACQNVTTGVTFENSYYRTFPLTDFGVTTPFSVTSVSFAVERATAGTGASQPAELRIGTYAGTLNASSFALSQLTQLARATIAIPNDATTLTTPISAFTPATVTVAPDAVLYAELLIPDGTAVGNTFYIGSNDSTETHPSYLRAPDCQLLSP